MLTAASSPEMANKHLYVHTDGMDDTSFFGLHGVDCVWTMYLVAPYSDLLMHGYFHLFLNHYTGPMAPRMDRAREIREKDPQ